MGPTSAQMQLQDLVQVRAERMPSPPLTARATRNLRQLHERQRLCCSEVHDLRWGCYRAQTNKAAAAAQRDSRSESNLSDGARADMLASMISRNPASVSGAGADASAPAFPDTNVAYFAQDRGSSLQSDTSFMKVEPSRCVHLV